MAPTQASPSTSIVIFVLGGPGSGKGTQCATLVKHYGFTHLSAGDLLREEQDNPDSKRGDEIKDCIKNGQIVPMEVTIALLEAAMHKAITAGKRPLFLIDGFPRKLDQAQKFEETVCKSRFTLFMDCPEDVMQERLLDRGKTSGRSDDNAESIKKRFKTFEDQSMPVVDYYEKEDRVEKVSATGSKEHIYEKVKQAMDRRAVHPE
ncbi:MAG: bifunctional uridylate/adenylate kinase [Chrysothrix sp. TS-e1954]|nr:MAG: bifunctional uridylate/adenylate kinase [Chrysothrix sp. TS-e1954]